MLTKKKSLLAIVALILITTAALAALGNRQSPLISSSTSWFRHRQTSPVTLAAETIQDKILKGGDGLVTVALNLTAASLPAEEGRPATGRRPGDRSGPQRLHGRSKAGGRPYGGRRTAGTSGTGRPPGPGDLFQRGADAIALDGDDRGQPAAGGDHRQTDPRRWGDPFERRTTAGNRLPVERVR